MKTLWEFAPWHCWAQGHKWVRCLYRGLPHDLLYRERGSVEDIPVRADDRNP